MKLYEAMDMFGRFERSDKGALKEQAVNHYENLLYKLKQDNWKEDDAYAFLGGIIVNIINADKNHTSSELDLFNWVNTSKYTFSQFIKYMTTQEVKDHIHRAFTIQSPDIKDEIALLALCTAAIDGHINIDECEFISLITD